MYFKRGGKKSVSHFGNLKRKHFPYLWNHAEEKDKKKEKGKEKGKEKEKNCSSVKSIDKTQLS
jgi:hypothetical protein